MVKTLERYKKCNYGAPETTNISTREALEISSKHEYLKPKGRYEALKRSQRNLLAPLNSKELELLERQLDMSLKQIRFTRTQFMVDTLTDLQRQDQALNEANGSLKQRLMGDHQMNSLGWNPNANEMGFVQQPPQGYQD